MDVRHRKVILDHLDELVERTTNIDVIIKSLFEYQVLNEYMVKHLKTYHALRRRTKELYLMLLGRGPHAFDKLLVVLRSTENFSAEKLLDDFRVNVYEYVNHLNAAFDEFDLGSPKNETEVVNNERPERELIVKKHPEGKFMDVGGGENGLRECYNMRSKPRGLALLINIHSTPGLKDRVGSEKDMAKLTTLFDQLGFTVIGKTNLTDQEIRIEVAKLKADPRLVNIDCLVVFIMCHGRQKGKTERSAVELLAYNGKPIDTNWLTSEFQSSETTLPFLKGKPKLFFFQACRAVEEEEGKASGSSQRFSRHIDVDSEVFSGCEMMNDKVGQPSYGDTVLCFSTIPGNNSMRDRETGGWFVDAFCEVTAKNAWQHDFDELWCQIDEKMREKAGGKYFQTTELVKRGFNLIFFWNPHLYGD